MQISTTNATKTETQEGIEFADFGVCKAWQC